MRTRDHVVEAKHGHISVVGTQILVDSGWGAKAYISLTNTEMHELIQLIHDQLGLGHDPFSGVAMER